MRLTFSVGLGLSIVAIGGLAATIDGLLRERLAHSQTTYRIGVSDDFPIQARRSDGAAEGLAVDVVSEAARRAGIYLEWVYALEGPDAALASKRVDLWPIITVLPERKRRIHITIPWMDNEYILLGTHAVDAKLAGLKLAILDFPINHLLGHQYFPDADLVGVQTDKAGLEAVCSGQAEAFLQPARSIECTSRLAPSEHTESGQEQNRC